MPPTPRAGCSRWIGFLLFILLSGCSEEEILPPDRYLRIVLRAGSVGGTRARAARVELNVGDVEDTPPSLCINTDGKEGETVASVVLRRSAGADLSVPVLVRVTAFEQLAGHDLVSAGKEFACPSQLPEPLAPPQMVELPFCDAGEPRDLVFHLAAACPCTEGLTCGAGLSTSGETCSSGECCSARIPNACALELAR
ncbi:MAG: hypothetical protein RMJ98_17260 [Myxococcales bacterium]|nr:hypothetical protein [Polyangiaceae bacterium]MDW8251045.1 hypothetical protein [Myxococcales bacterium]